MSEKFTVEIVSPDKSVIRFETTEVIIPSYEGEMGIMKNHISLITFLRPGLIKIKGDSQEIFFVEEGTVEFSDNQLVILTSTAKNLKNIDNILSNQLIEDAEAKITKNVTDKEKYILSHKIDTLRNIN